MENENRAGEAAKTSRIARHTGSLPKLAPNDCKCRINAAEIIVRQNGRWTNAGWHTDEQK
jgi:hypothetical protein